MSEAKINVKVTGDAKAKSKLGSLASFIKSRVVISIHDLGRAFDTAKKFVLSFLQTSGQFEQWQIAFETMLGDAKVANDLLKQLAQTAKTTPFELTELTQAAKQLLAVGIEANKVNETVRMLGDVAAGLSVPIGRLILNLGQVQSQGKLTGRELRDFAIAGVPLLEELANTMGKSTVEISSMVSAGKIGFPEVEKAFSSMTSQGGRFYKLMDKQSQSLLGSWSNLKDSATLLRNEIGENLLPIGKGFVNMLIGMTDGVKATVEWFDKLVDRLNGIKDGFEDIDMKSYGKQLEQLTDEQLKNAEKELQASINKLSKKQKINKEELKLYDNLTKKDDEYTQKVTNSNEVILTDKEAQLEDLKKIDEETTANLSESLSKREVIRKENIRRGLEAEKKAAEERARIEAASLEELQKQAESQAEMFNEIFGDAFNTLFDDSMSFQQNLSKAMIGTLNTLLQTWLQTIIKAKVAEVAAETAKETGKAGVMAPLSLGASLLAIAPIAAAGAAATAALSSIKFEQGGQFERKPNISTTTSGQKAIDNERGLERVTVEPIGKRDNTSSGSPIQVNIQIDGKTMAKQLIPYIRAVERRVI